MGFFFVGFDFFFFLTKISCGCSSLFSVGALGVFE